MKYILAEQIKYILREDISDSVWTDAIDIVGSYKNKQDVDTLINKLKSAANVDKTTADNIESITKIVDELEDGGDMTNKEVISNKYKKALEDLFNLFKSQDLSISTSNSEFAKLSELSKKEGQLSDNEIEEAKSIFSTIKNLGNTEEDSFWAEVDNKEKINLVNSLSYMLNNSEKVETRLNELRQKYNTIEKDKKSAYDNLISEIDNTISLNDISNNNYHKAIRLSELFKNILDAIKIEYTKGTDWAEELKKASDRKKVWDSYYKVEWGENADFVKKLGSAVIVELNHFGFSEKVNPFITFIKTLINEKFVINDAAYSAVHDAYVNHYINSNDLRNTTNTQDKILFCKDLYTHSGGEILEYLRRRHEIIQKPTESTINGYTTKSILNTAYNLFNEDYQLPNADPNNAIEIGDYHALSKLNTLSKIEENIVIVFGEAEEKNIKTKIDDAWYTSFEKDAGANNIENWAKAAICYVLLYITVNGFIDESKLDEYKNKFKKITQQEFSELSSINSTYYKKMIKRFANTKIDRTNFDNILTTLYDRYVDKKTD